ncbi:MAG: hypothetical protein AAGN15_16265 [Cyanobacteria bacterium J06581_3]
MMPSLTDNELNSDNFHFTAYREWGFDYAQPPGFDYAQPPGFGYAQPPDEGERAPKTMPPLNLAHSGGSR